MDELLAAGDWSMETFSMEELDVGAGLVRLSGGVEFGMVDGLLGI